MGLYIYRKFMVVTICMSLLLSNTRQSCETSTNQTFLVRKNDAPSFCNCSTEVSIGCRLANDEYPDYYSCDGLSVYDRIQCCTIKHLVKCCSGWRKLYDSCSIPVCKPSCMNGGLCIAPQVCRCIPGYKGTKCQTPICDPPCDNGGHCIAPRTCSCVTGYTGRSCSRGICTPSCLNGGQCVAPQICKCVPGFYGKLCEKGDALANLYTPTLRLVNQSAAAIDSWYRVASPYSKACFLKIYIKTICISIKILEKIGQVNQTQDIVTFTSTSYDREGNPLGNYTSLAVDEKNSIRNSQRSACLNIKCPEEGKIGLTTTRVVTKANTDKECNISILDRRTSKVLGNNILETSIKSGDGYGPLYGIYTAYGYTLSSKTVAEKMCQIGKGGVNEAVHVASAYGFQLLGEVFPSYYHYKQHDRTRRSVRPSFYTRRRLLKHPKINGVDQVLWKVRHYRATPFNDQFWPDMWYIRSASPSMKLAEAWDLGYRGNGMTIGIVDDGVDITHPDLAANIAKTSSYDFYANDRDPSSSLSSLGHGTKCAGAAAAVANNSLCGLGSAYKAKIAGIRASDGGSSSVMEARSLNHDWNKIQIYSNSWGGEDKKGFDGPDSIVKQAIIRGIVHGRSGYGSIYVWAAGNGENEDNCNADGYANSIYTIAISSVNSDGYAASFSEFCSAAMAVTYSQSTSTSNIVTTKMGGRCDTSFTGTSASAPIAAGIIALALQAKNDMTWRDVQHLIVNTAKMSGLHGRDIASNGAGKRFSHFFGFGLLDAEAMVTQAASWTLVPSQRTCTGPNTAIPNGRINGPTRQVLSKIQSKGCEGTIGEIKFLEHVVTEITFSATQRGQVELFLTSPSGTTTTLLSVRLADNSYSGSITWSYMSVHFWGEDPKGNWTLKMSIGDISTSGSLDKWKLTLYGTKIDPKLGKSAEPDPVTMTVPTTIVPDKTTSRDTSASIVIGIIFGICFAVTCMLFTRFYLCTRRKICKSNKVEDDNSKHINDADHGNKPITDAE